MDFHSKQVVWAKVKGYPWWPAYISKLPEDSDGTYKVIFFAEDTYALLQPRCVQKFTDNYIQHSKTKAKKFLKALELANNFANRISFVPTTKNCGPNKKKPEKKQQQECAINSEDNEESQQSISQKNQQSQSPLQNKQIQQLIQNQDQEIDRKKIEKIQNELSEMVSNFQSNRVKQWKFSKYFQQFLKQYQLNSEQILHSNLTRKIRFIIQNMRVNKFDQKQIDKLEQLSTFLKNKVLNYLTDTSYYDQHLKIIDKSRHNKVQIQAHIMKIMKKKYSQMKKQFINILAQQIGAQVGKNPKFKSKQFINDLKESCYDNIIKNINSKAATLRMADQLILRYRQ